jgi:hypothetical protein
LGTNYDIDNPFDLKLGSGLINLLNKKFEGQSEKMKIQNFRVQVSLGSTIESIHSISNEGIVVKYNHGDICNKENGERYSSEINF